MPACRYFLIRVNETTYLNWNDADGPRPDDVWSVYLCSPDIGTYLCEITPSTYLEHVDTFPTWRNGDVDWSTEEARQGTREADCWLEWGHDADHYQHRSDVLRGRPALAAWLAANPEPEDKIIINAADGEGAAWAFVGICDPDTDEGAEYLDNLREYVRCNSLL